MTEQQSRKCSLLVADDDPFVTKILASLLADEFEVLTANSGREAQDIFARCDVKLILSDTLLPEMTGMQLLEWVRQKYPRTIRLFMSGLPNLDMVLEVINRCHVFHFISKPFQADELFQILRQAARATVVCPSWLQWNNGTVAKLAQAICDENAFENLPILANALEEAGCDNEVILGHCRQSRDLFRGSWFGNLLTELATEACPLANLDHVRGWWVVDLLLGHSLPPSRSFDLMREIEECERLANDENVRLAKGEGCLSTYLFCSQRAAELRSLAYDPSNERQAHD
jgi:CheY-like chemotaxis protein